MRHPPPALLITRPEPEATELVDAVRAELNQPLEVISSPLIQIDPVHCDVNLNDYAAVIFTSTNGVKFGLQPRTERAMKAFCVGDRTAAAAAARGYVPISANGDAEDLKKLILLQEEDGKYLHLRGVQSRGEVAGSLKSAGLKVETAIVYRQIECALSKQAVTLLNTQTTVVVPLYSPKTAETLVNQGPWRANIVFVAISRAVAAVLSSVPSAKVIIAPEPNGEAMLNTICFALRGN